MAFQSETKDVSNATSQAANNLLNEPDSLTAQAPFMQIWLDRSKLPRTLLGGTAAMRLAGTEFLPKHTLESVEAYSRRLSCSTLLNAFRKTASYLTGQVFQSDIIFADNVEQSFLDWSEHVDTSGNDLNVFAKRVFFNGLGRGVSHIMIDAPKASDSIKTLEDEKKAGVRPYFREIHPESILGAIVSEDGFLEQVRIAEVATERIGRYGTKQVKKVRVLEPGKWELYRITDDDSETLEDSGTFSVPFIPLVTFIPGDDWTQVTGETPLMDLADLNASHWRSSSDQNNILHIARVPVLFGKHIDMSVMPVGVSSMIISDDDNADLKFVEHSGAAIDAGKNDLNEIEAQMALYGLQQLLPRTGNMTATEKALTSAESNSSLGTWATEFESTLNDAFKVAGAFAGIEFPDNGISVNHEYSFGVVDPQEIAQLLKAQEQGVLSAQAVFSEIRRRGMVDEHLAWEDVDADIEQEKRDAIDMAQMAGNEFGNQEEPAE